MNVRLFLLIALIGAAATGCQAPAKSAPPRKMRMENLLRQALVAEIAPNREIIISYVEIPPHTTMQEHWHPGEEFHYYLEGEVTIDFEGKRQIAGKAGEVGHVPLRQVHTAVTGDKGARILVFRVHVKGKPVRYLTEGGAAEK